MWITCGYEQSSHSGLTRILLYNYFMEFSLLTYNVLYNKAFNELGDIIQKHSPDIICLQEVDTDETNLRKLGKNGYKLADYSNSFLKFGKIFGVATYYNSNTVTLLDSNSIFLPKSIYEILLTGIRVLLGGNRARTLLETSFSLRNSVKEFKVYNTHLTVYGANGARIKQIKEALEYINTQKKIPVIISGDFNYFPYARKRLERLMQKYRLSEATKSIHYTALYSSDGKNEQYNLIQRFGARLIRKFFHGKLKVDYIYYKNLKLMEAKRINVCFSDHFPIIATFLT